MSLDNLTGVEAFRWFSLGQAVRRGGGKEATMYSYNGVVLPKLPEWDKTSYPYAYLHVNPDYPDMPWLWVSDTPFYVTSDGKRDRATDYYVAYYRWRRLGLLPTSAFGWDYGFGFSGSPGSHDETYGWIATELNLDISEIPWANFDVLNEDGSVYLSKSDPIPVYE